MRDFGSSIGGIYVSSEWGKMKLKILTWCPIRSNASSRSELKDRPLNVTVRVSKNFAVMTFLSLAEVPRRELISCEERWEKTSLRICSFRNILRNKGGVCLPIFAGEIFDDLVSSSSTLIVAAKNDIGLQC